MEFIELKKVATNNLKNIDVRLPIGKFSVVTGVSGSGKSSLVFDTLYSEAYRRYVESLSSFARQYLKALPKPDIAEVKNLPPAIAVKQTRSLANSRSTVGTMTEVYDLLRIIFTHCSEIICPTCRKKVVSDSGESIAKDILDDWQDKSILILAPLKYWQKIAKKELQKQLLAQGFSRLLHEDKLARLEDIKATDLSSAFVVIDRIVSSAQNFRRMAEGFELALKVGRGFASAQVENARERKDFSSDLNCQSCGSQFVEPTLALFSFNHPYGACPRCQGFGYEGVLDWDKVIPKKEDSLTDESVVLWNFGNRKEMYSDAKKSARINHIDFNKPFAKYNEKEWQWLKSGDGKGFIGVDGFYRWLEEHRHKAHYRIHAARFKKYVPCGECNIGRINSAARACRIQDLNIVDVCNLSVEKLGTWVGELATNLPQLARASGKRFETAGIHEAVSEAQTRIDYLQRVGLGYLTLNRTTRTLSGGEQQRIHMSRCLGSALTDTLYCLDEPTSGLHARDSKNLLSVIHGLRDQGNTIVVVEHDKQIMAAADHLLEIGPGAGHKGGEVVFDGKPPRRIRESRSLLQESRAIDARTPKLVLKGAHTHNLQHVDVEFCKGMLNVVCGVSGSGKTSLVQHTLYPILAKFFGETADEASSDPKATSIGPEAVLKSHSQAVFVSQSPIGRSSRSNIATYLGVFEEIRKLLASTEQAKALKLTPGSFSFNTPGGRCETCRGLGTVIEDLSFLGEMAVICPTCNGKRFEENVLQITYRGKSLSDILKMTIVEAKELFFDRSNLVQVLDSIIDMGMGYVTIGQNTHSFSGGEAQRLKLIKLIKETKKDPRALILIFDEPTTGLSDKDVQGLIHQFHKLTDSGHTLIIVEHHLDVIAHADWLVEVGPEAAERGGTVIFQGPVELLKKHRTSIIAPFLWDKPMADTTSEHKERYEQIQASK